MARSLRRSRSASAAIATNSLPRWLISITDMPASCQLTSSLRARSSTSTGIVAGPAPKLWMRCGASVDNAAFRGSFAIRALARSSVSARAVAVRAVSARAIAVRTIAAGAVAALALVVTIHDCLHAGKLLAFAEVDERHALRGSAHLADLIHPGADENAAVGGQHDLVVGRDQRGGDHLAVALACLDRDHPLRSAPMARVFDDRGALAEAVLCGGEHALALVLRDQQRDDLAALREIHTPHAPRPPSHRPHVVLVEAHRLALVGEEHHVMLAVGERDVHEAIALVQIDGDDSRRSRTREIR